MSPVEIERIKLSAAAVNTVATSCFTVGAIAPLAAAIYGAGPSGSDATFVAIGAIAWISVAVALRFAARRILGGLQP
jgi:hypothetical protein